MHRSKVFSFHPVGRIAPKNAYIKFKGNAPSEKVCRDLLLDLPGQTKSELRWINKQVISLKAKSEGYRDVAMDIDDTVCTVYGDQEGAGVGYDPTGLRSRIGSVFLQPT